MQQNFCLSGTNRFLFLPLSLLNEEPQQLESCQITKHLCISLILNAINVLLARDCISWHMLRLLHVVMSFDQYLFFWYFSDGLKSGEEESRDIIGFWRLM
jgi:hypothetical protein